MNQSKFSLICFVKDIYCILLPVDCLLCELGCYLIFESMLVVLNILVLEFEGLCLILCGIGVVCLRKF